jgi:hypothetical protein
MNTRGENQGTFWQTKPAYRQSPEPSLPKAEFMAPAEKKPIHHRNGTGHKKQLSHANINETKMALNNRRFSPSPQKKYS